MDEAADIKSVLPVLHCSDRLQQMLLFQIQLKISLENIGLGNFAYMKLSFLKPYFISDAGMELTCSWAFLAAKRSCSVCLFVLKLNFSVFGQRMTTYDSL